MIYVQQPEKNVVVVLFVSFFLVSFFLDGVFFFGGGGVWIQHQKKVFALIWETNLVDLGFKNFKMGLEF